MENRLLKEIYDDIEREKISYTLKIKENYIKTMKKNIQLMFNNKKSNLILNGNFEEKIDDLIFLEEKEVTLFFDEDYNYHSSFYYFLNENMSFPSDFNIYKKLSFNHLDKNFSESINYQTLYNLFKGNLAEKSFTNFLEKNYLKRIFRNLMQKYRELEKFPLIIRAFTKIDLKEIRSIYFSELKRYDDKIYQNENFDFFKMSINYCVICKIYLCDNHFDSSIIKNSHYLKKDTTLLNTSYFIEKTKRYPIKDFYLKSKHKCYKENDFNFEIYQEELKKYENQTFLKILNYLFVLQIEDNCTISEIISVPCAIINHLYSKYKKKIENYIFFNDFFFNTLEKDSEFLNINLKQNFSSRDLDSSNLAKIDKQKNNYYKRKCNCKNICYKSDKENKRRNAQICICNSLQRECLPNICSCNCNFPPSVSEFIGNKTLCKNTNFFYRIKPKTKIAKSKVCIGYGLFSTQNLNKNEYLGYYAGEWLNNKEEKFIDVFTKIINSSYLFNTVSTNSFNVLDATFFGNETRFINHATEPLANVEVRHYNSFEGDFIIFLCNGNIDADGELFFDYGAEYNLSWKKFFDCKLKEYLKKTKNKKRKNKEKSLITKNRRAYENLL